MLGSQLYAVKILEKKLVPKLGNGAFKTMSMDTGFNFGYIECN